MTEMQYATALMCEEGVTLSLLYFKSCSIMAKVFRRQ